MAVAIILTVAACKNAADIPLPVDIGTAAPVIYPIKFDAPHPIVWEDSAATYIPQTSSFNYSQLPATVFDSSDFVPLENPVVQTELNWDYLPSSPFYYDSLPSKPLRFETYLLAPPTVIRTEKRKLKSGSGDLLFDLGEPLNSGYFTAMTSAKDGRIWSYVFGKGLCCYDGQTVSVYKINKITTAAVDIKEDDRGQIWLSTFSDGIFVIDITSGIIRQINTEKGLPANCSYNLMVDKSNRVWAGFVPQEKGQKGGVVIIDMQNNELKTLQNYQGITKYWAVSLIQDKAENIWILSDSNNVDIIDLRHNNSKRLNNALKFEGDTLTQIKQDRTNRIWLSGLRSINVVDSNKKVVYQIKPNKTTKREFVSTLTEDQNGNMWVGGKISIRIFDKSLQHFKTLITSSLAQQPDFGRITQDGSRQMIFTSYNGSKLANAGGYHIKRIGDHGISCYTEDESGRIWEGGLYTGIQIIDTATGIAKRFNQSNGLRNDSVQCLLAGDGHIVIATRTSLQVVDSGLKKMEMIAASQGLTMRNIGTIATDKNNNLWVSGYRDTGIDIINLRQKTMRHLGRKQGLADVSIVDIKVNKNGQIWFCSQSDGIGVIDLQKKTIQHITKQNPIIKKGQSPYAWLAFDSLGNTWLGTSDGLYAINATNDSAAFFSTNQGLLSNTVISVKEFHGHIYAGTKKGLNIITPPYLSASKKWEVRGIGEMHGIGKVTNSINSDLISRNGQYWWGDIGNTIIANIDEQISNPFIPPTLISGVEVLNKKLYITNSPWDILGKKDTIRSSNNDSSYYTNGKTLPTDSALAHIGLQWDSVGSFNLPVNLQLPHNKNYLQFHFMQANMGSVDTVWYRYILQGVDKEWSEITSNTESENYLNLSPGKYTFKVASLAAGTWQMPAEFSFTILNPWWKTWWAYSLYIIIFVFVVWRIIQYRSNQLQEDKKRLEEMVAQRTNELSQSITQLQATQSQLVQSEKMASLGELTAGIAHEIQNPLNFVNNFSEVNQELLAEMMEEIEKKNYDEVIALAKDVVDNEQKINHHGKRADAIVKGMLQHSRSNSGQKEPTDINKLVDEYLRLAYHGLRAKDKTFNATLKTEYDESVGNVSIIPQDIGRVILNLITNAFYAVDEKKRNLQAAAAGESYTPTVTVVTKRLHSVIGDSGISISVKDNGAGVPQKVIDKIFQPFFTTKPTGQGTGLGLSLAYDIVKAHGGSLAVNSEEGQGCAFTIELPNTK